MKPPRNCILVSVDSLRFDALSCEPETRFLTRHGSRLPARRRTPRLDRMASEGLHFGRVYASAPYTTNSHAGLFTGLWPWNHRVRSLWGKGAVPDSVPTLAELLSQRGFRTASASGMPHIFHKKTFGLERGFDRRIDLSTHFLNSSVSSLWKWLDEIGRERFFLFYHSASVHDYLTERQWRRYANVKITEADLFYKELRRPLRGTRLRQMTAYIDAVNFFDRNELAGLVQAVEKRGLLEDTLIVVLGDHGEPHPYGLKEEEVRVPAVFWAAGNYPRTRKVSAAVRLMDIFPTVLSLLEIDPPQPLDAVSLLDKIQSSLYEDREIYMELWRSSIPAPKKTRGGTAKSGADEASRVLWRALQKGTHKLVRDAQKLRTVAYDLEKDWRESRSRPAEGKPVFLEMFNRLDEIQRQDPDSKIKDTPKAPEDLPSREVVERLRQLGYLD